ncbi:hypothetical protein AD928_01205, partial [Acetobacter cerevisiae]
MPASETIDVQQKGGDPVLFWNLCLFYEKPNAYLGVGKEATAACLLSITKQTGKSEGGTDSRLS